MCLPRQLRKRPALWNLPYRLRLLVVIVSALHGCQNDIPDFLRYLADSRGR